MAAAIEVADLSFSYPSPLPDEAPIPALHHVRLTIEAGQFVALMGPVGAGKTTLCLALNGLVPEVTGGEFSGQVTVDGLDTAEHRVSEIATRVGLVFQEAEIQLFNASVEDEIAFGLEGLRWPPDAIEARIDWALDAVGLQGFRGRTPQTLSGGEQKRLAIATVLAAAPSILVLDEPTEGLDPRGKSEVMTVIQRLAVERNATVVMATQDPEVVALFADRVILLNGGRVLRDGPARQVLMALADQPQCCVGVPQLATLASRLRRATGEQIDFLTAEEAHKALGPSLTRARGEGRTIRVS